MTEKTPISLKELTPVIKSVYARTKYYSTKTYKDKPVMLVYTDRFKDYVPNELNPENTGKTKMIKQAGYYSNKIDYNVEDTIQSIMSQTYYHSIYVEIKLPRKTYLDSGYTFPEGYVLADNIIRHYDDSFIINLPKNFVGAIEFRYSTNYRRTGKDSDRCMYDCILRTARKGSVNAYGTEYIRVLKISTASSFDINFSE